jgi:hypothetical protein
MHGRYHVSVKDIQALARPVLRHRVIPNFYAESEGITSDDLVEQLLEAVPCPRAGCSAMAEPTPARTALPRSGVIARLGTIELKARTIVEGFLSGCTAARSRGSASSSPSTGSTCPATTSQTLDWKVYARSRSALRQEVRGGNQPRLPRAARRQRLDGLRRRRARCPSSNTARCWPRRWRS